MQIIYCYLYLNDAAYFSWYWLCYHHTPNFWKVLDHMQRICTSLQTDNHTYILSLNFYRPDALHEAQPTVSKHWTQIRWYYINKCDLCIGIHPSCRPNSKRWRWSWTCSVNSSSWRVGISALLEAESCATQWIWVQLGQDCKHSAAG